MLPLFDGGIEWDKDSIIMNDRVELLDQVSQQCFESYKCSDKHLSALSS